MANKPTIDEIITQYRNRFDERITPLMYKLTVFGDAGDPYRMNKYKSMSECLLDIHRQIGEEYMNKVKSVSKKQRIDYITFGERSELLRHACDCLNINMSILEEQHKGNWREVMDLVSEFDVVAENGISDEEYEKLVSTYLNNEKLQKIDKENILTGSAFSLYKINVFPNFPVYQVCAGTVFYEEGKEDGITNRFEIIQSKGKPWTFCPWTDEKILKNIDENSIRNEIKDRLKAKIYEVISEYTEKRKELELTENYTENVSFYTDLLKNDIVDVLVSESTKLFTAEDIKNRLKEERERKEAERLAQEEREAEEARIREEEAAKAANDLFWEGAAAALFNAAGNFDKLKELNESYELEDEARREAEEQNAEEE